MVTRNRTRIRNRIRNHTRNSANRRCSNRSGNNRSNSDGNGTGVCDTGSCSGTDSEHRENTPHNDKRYTNKNKKLVTT